MIVEEITGTHIANCHSELKAILNRRHAGDVNAFWLALERGGFPTLMILIKRDLAVLHYFLVEDELGLRSLGEEGNGEFLLFSISRSSADDVQEPRESIVTLDIAWQAAKDFFDTQKLPQVVRWREL